MICSHIYISFLLDIKICLDYKVILGERLTIQHRVLVMDVRVKRRSNVGTSRIIYLTNNKVYHAMIKYIDVSFHNVKKLFTFGHILLKKIHSSFNVADILIRSVTTNKFKHFLDLLRVS